MENLPVEILNEIFKSLHQKDKVECMLVCSSWEYAIKNTVLFNTIRIRNKAQLDKLVDNMRLEPRNGDRAERLMLEVEDFKKSDINTLSHLFPNIGELTIVQNLEDEDPQSTETPSFQPWTKTIKFITNIYDTFPTYQILMGDICPKLTELRINGEFKNPSEKLIELLRNAPNLKVLKLWNYKFSLMNLEVLHNNVPLLESISLTYSYISADIFPIDMKPTKYMKELHLKSIDHKTNESFINFEKYVTKKYPCVIHFGFDFVLLRPNDYNLEVCMNRGFAFQIQHIGPNLTSLEYTPNDNSFQYLFPILDQNECKIKRFTIAKRLGDSEVQQITESKQAQYIQALSCILDSSSAITENFNNLVTLTELRISFDGSNPAVILNTIIREIGSNLETFELSYASIILDETSIQACPKLKTLNIKYCTLPPNADILISEAFPNLRKLLIDVCDWSSPEFHLKNLSLCYLEIRISLPADTNYILITTTSNNEKRWYTADKVFFVDQSPANDPSMYPAIKSLPFDKHNGNPFKTFVCNSLSKFFLMNYYP